MTKSNAILTINLDNLKIKLNIRFITIFISVPSLSRSQNKIL